MIKRKDLEHHKLEECEYRVIQCQWCKEDFPFINIEVRAVFFPINAHVLLNASQINAHPDHKILKENSLL